MRDTHHHAASQASVRRWSDACDAGRAASDQRQRRTDADANDAGTDAGNPCKTRKSSVVNVGPTLLGPTLPKTTRYAGKTQRRSLARVRGRLAAARAAQPLGARTNNGETSR